jgi:hypothetical protein
MKVQPFSIQMIFLQQQEALRNLLIMVSKTAPSKSCVGESSNKKKININTQKAVPPSYKEKQKCGHLGNA